MFTIEKWKNIRSFIFDMDGVLTDGLLYIGNDGEYIRTSNMKDGYALQLAIKKGYSIFIISGAESISYKIRLEKLGLQHVYMNVKDKVEFLNTLVNESRLNLEEALYMGDDVPDIECMKKCFISSCPSNAVDDVKMYAMYISPFEGGNGCVRDVIEKVLRVRDDWSDK